MSDLVLGAIIGASGVALGAIIAGFWNYCVTKLRLGSQEKEAQRNRLVDSRKEVLLPLRNIIGEWVECSKQQLNMIVRFQKATAEYKQGSPERNLEIKEFFEVSEKLKSLSSWFNEQSALISDRTLEALIEAVKYKQSEVDVQRLPLIRFFNNPGDADINDLESAFDKDQLLLKEVRTQVLQVNKRIEELLSGEPAT